MNNIYKNILRASISILVFFIASQAETQEIINNDSLRFGNGAEQSINATGNVQQPFYYNSTSMLWRKLTYSSYPLDYSVAIGGDGTSEWNTNGTMVNNPTLVGQVIDNSSFITTTGNNGYGTIISTGTINVGGSNLEIQSIYELGETDNFIKITTQITNNSGAAISNLRYWVGTRDDYVGGTDGPQKQRGNLVDGAFQINTAATERASALLIKTSTEGVLFYTDSEKGNNIIQSCCSWSNVTNQNPQTAAIDATGDGSYGFYVRMNDLANGESDEFNWYYAAGELGVLDDIIADVAHASGAVNNITCDAADYTAKVNVDATGYYIVVDEGSTAPTEAQIKAGVDYSGVSVIAQGTSAMTADVDHVFNITGLTVEMDYDLYFVAEDAVPQFTAIINSAFSTDDTTDPETPILADVTGECDATITETAPTTTDACAGTITGTTTDPLTYTSQGTHVVAWTFDDGNGNSIVVNQNVIIDDVTDPLTPTLEDVTGECEATAVAPTTTDACAGTITGTTTDPLTYTTQGTHIIAWTFDDGNGNSIVVNQNVIIDDVTDPLTPTLEDVTGECEATAVAPTTTDACAGTITGTTTDPLTYTSQGTHIIAWTFDDGNGNSIVVNQNVIIDDVTDPLTPTLEDVMGECEVTTVAPTTTDACAGTITGTTTDPLTYTTQGTHVVAWTFDDGNGNSIVVNQNVIIDDVTDPLTPTLEDVTGECEATAVAPTTTDACA
ncbi:MAG: hypothetical protein N4A71_17985, partial [Carboxylicivirga sp.]|nr:hypothetical protein [Carboxylicivirga sp.]